MKTYYTIHLTPHQNGYTVTVPALPSCVTGGKTVQEALEMAVDALGLCLIVMQDEGEALPAPGEPGDFPAAQGATSALIPINLLEYRARMDSRAVRKNVSLPAWMATMAEARGINCSQVLQEGLRTLLDA